MVGFGLSAICCLSLTALAQSTSTSAERQRRAVSEKQIDTDLKMLLNDYYTGKPVRAKVVIPANDRGVEVIDGQLKAYPLSAITAAVQPGELVLIKELKFKNRAIEVYFNGENLSENAAPAPTLSPVGNFGSEANARPSVANAKLVNNKTKSLHDPRVILKFSREIGTQDLNLQSINRLLAPAVDVTSLNPNARLSVSNEAPTTRLDPNAIAQQEAADKGIAAPPIISELIGAGTGIGEIVIECSTNGARLYIDGAYSGAAPRTIRMTRGVHTILLLASGYEQWEQTFFLPAGKAALIKAELKPSH